MASGQQALGIDVSHYKNHIDWNRVMGSGVSFAIIKATEANNFIDSRFDYNWTQARRVGLIRGAYHFFRPLVDPVSQAQHFLRIVGNILHKTDLPPVLDVEVYPDFIKNEYRKIPSSERQQRVKIWLQTIEAATGRVPMIYTDYYTWRDFLGNSDVFSRYPLWIAAYKVDKPRIPANEWGGKGWTFWQHTNRGVVPGIRDEAACVDMNHYIDDLDALKSWLNISEPRSVPPPISNGDMMAALIDTAEALNASSDELIARTRLRYLVEPIGNSLRPYDGPAIEELPLSAAEKEALDEALGNFNMSITSLGITHQDMINAIYYAASLEDMGGWSLVIKAGLGYIGDKRDEIYKGPDLEDLPGLTWQHKEAIAAFLGVEIKTDSEPEIEEEVIEETQPPEYQETDLPQTPTYSSEMTNQAVINAFYLMALELDVNGQMMIASAGLEDLGETRNTAYSGPKIENLPGLTWEVKLHLARLLNVVIVLPNDEIKVDQEIAQESEQQEAPQEPQSEVEPEPDPEPEPEVEPEVEQVEQEAEEVEELPEAVDDQPVDEPGDPQSENQPVPELPVSDHPEPEEEQFWFPSFSNQDVIEAFFEAAETLGKEGWSLLEQAGLLDLDIDRAGRFLGLAEEKIEQLGDDVADLVVNALGLDNKKSLAKVIDEGEPYPGMVNLDMVNLFYKAAARAGESGQQWLDVSGMSYLNKSRGSRFRPYRGPEIANFLKLSRQQRETLQAVLEENSRENSLNMV